ADRVRRLQHRPVVGAVRGLRPRRPAHRRLPGLVARAQLALVEPTARRADRSLPRQPRSGRPRPELRAEHRLRSPSARARRRHREEIGMRSTSTWDWPRILYGDWTWFVRDWIDVLRVVFIGGTVVFAAQGRSDVMALAAASIVLLVARIIDLPR